MKTSTPASCTVKEIALMGFIIMALGFPVGSACAQNQGAPPPSTDSPAHNKGDKKGEFTIIPPRVLSKLNLTDDQQKQLESLNSEVRSKIETILTSDQLAQLRQLRMRPRGNSEGQGGPGPLPGGNPPPPPPLPANPPAPQATATP